MPEVETELGVGWFDNHCHLTSLEAAPSDVVDDAAEAGVTQMLTVGCTVDDSRRALDVASRFDNVWATAGVHPHDAKDGIDGLDELLAGAAAVAVGECGLDYHYDHSPRPTQRAVFARQIELAHRHRLPLVVHTREAWDDTFAVLDEVGVPDWVVFHCFTGGPAEAVECLERGAHISFSGIVTFKAAHDVRAAAAVTPRDRMLVETDSPYLSPVPYRGKPNRPALVPFVGHELARIHGVAIQVVADATAANARAVYGPRSTS